MTDALEHQLHQADTRNRLLTWSVAIVAALACVAVGLIVFWSLAPDQVIEIKHLPVPVITKTVSSDQVMIQRYDLCKVADARGKVERTLVSSVAAVALPTITDTLNEGCIQDAAVPTLLPPQARPDRYRLHYKVTYTLNPLKTVVQEWDSEPFQVIAEE
jgi:hypothetical protein